MLFADLYNHVSQMRRYPVSIERSVVPKVIEITGQDRVYFTPVELDTDISLGHIKQYVERPSVYGDPIWVADIRYAAALNICWKRYVCCKELMHVFDTEDEQSGTAAKFLKLLEELESPPLAEQASEVYLSENRTKWKALAILCPLPVRDHVLARRLAGELSDEYDIALELRLPEAVVPTILSARFPTVLDFLLQE